MLVWVQHIQTVLEQNTLGFGQILSWLQTGGFSCSVGRMKTFFQMQDNILAVLFVVVTKDVLQCRMLHSCGREDASACAVMGFKGTTQSATSLKIWFRGDQLFYIWLMLNFLVYGLLERNSNYKHSPWFYAPLSWISQSMRYHILWSCIYLYSYVHVSLFTRSVGTQNGWMY